MGGIPSITLLGPDDGRAIRRRAEVLAEFDLADWVAVLLAVIEDVDGDFWRDAGTFRLGCHPCRSPGTSWDRDPDDAPG